MTIASKTVLVNFRKVRGGMVFADVCAKSTIDTTGISSFVHLGNTFFGVGNTTTETYTSTTKKVRLGLSYTEVTTKSTVDSSYGQGRTRLAQPYVVKFAGTSSYPTMEAYKVRLGNSFNDITAKSTINASEFDVVRLGAPFWVRYTGSTPPPFNASQFFAMF